MLPKIMIPKFAVTLPSTGKEVTFRPFLVREEKALLLAVESQDQATIIRTIKDAITTCVDDVNVSSLPYFDIEYLFLNLRSKSIGEDVKFTYRHSDSVNREGLKCDAATDVSIKLDEINVTRNPDHTDKFMIDDRLGIKMKYPTIDNIQKLASDGKNELALMASCIEFVWECDNVHTPESIDEAVQFIESMNTKQYEKLTKFFETMPALTHTLTYNCIGCGQRDTITFSGVSDFF